MTRTPLHTRGYTLTEILIVLAILALLTAVALATFIDIRKKQVQKVVSEEVFGMLLEAQGDTLAARNGSAYGVRIFESQAVFFEGPTFNPADTNNITYTFLSPIVATTSMPGLLPVDVVFARLTGTPSVSGTIELIDQTGRSTSTIQIYASGLIEYD